MVELPPLDQLGSKTQFRLRIFGGPEHYFAALTELERQIYKDSA